LQQRDRELGEELFKLRLRHASGQLESPAQMRRVRRDIARVKTIMRVKEVQKA